jgi:hypothetical protein
MMLLISNARSTNDDQRPTYSMYMILLQFSTREYHPLAHRPRIDVQDYERGQRVALEIAGDNLALLVGTHRMAQLFIFDWKTGHKRLVRSYANPSPFSLNICLFYDSNIKLRRTPTLVNLLSYHLKFLSYPT